MIFIIVLFSALYVAINSSFVFDKVARHFAPQYDIRYDGISGNVLQGITISGLHYKDKELAKEIKVKINPATLLRKRVTVSLLSLDDVNVEYIEYMVAQFATDDDDDEESSPLPVSIKVNDIHISILPFEEYDIEFNKSTIDVEYLFYANDEFDLGDIHLFTKTSMGDVDIKGRFEDSNLNLSSVDISNLNTIAVEQMISSDDNSSDDNTSEPTEETNTTDSDDSNMFIPKTIHITKADIGVMARSYEGVMIDLLTLKGHDLDINLNSSTLSGRLGIDLVTDVAKATLAADMSPKAWRVDTVSFDDINLSKILAIVDEMPESNTTDETNSSSDVADKTPSDKTSSEDTPIPYLANSIEIGSIKAAILPMVYDDIGVQKLTLDAKSLSVDIAKSLLTKGSLDISIDTDLASLTHRGMVENNLLRSQITLVPKSSLIEKYDLPLRDGAIKNIKLDALTNKNGVAASIRLQAHRLLDANESEFNLDINRFKTKVKYIFATQEMHADINSSITTPYTKEAALQAVVTMSKDGDIAYSGSVSSAQIDDLDANIASLVQSPKVTFVGSLDEVSADISTAKIKGTFVSKDLKKGLLHIETISSLAIGELVELPKELNATKAKLMVDAPIDFNNTMPINAKVKLTSNVLNMDADVEYGDTLTVTAASNIPKSSLLSGFDKNIKLDALSPMSLGLTMQGDNLQASVDSKGIKLSAKYDLNSSAIQGHLDLAGTKLQINAPDIDHITISQSTKSLQSLIKSINGIYKMELPQMSGDIALNAKVNDLKSAQVTLRSNEFILGKDKKTGTVVSSILLVVDANKSEVKISKYRLKTSGVEIHSNKSSFIMLDGDDVTISPLWVNDTLKVTGKYNTAAKKGHIVADTSGTQIDHEMAEILTALNVKTDINGEKIAISGAVHLKGGKVKYNMDKKSFAADSDIIILQRQKKKNKSFENNFKINLSIDSSKPLVYKKKGISVEIVPDLTIKKGYGSSLKVNGKVELRKGGYYVFQNKKFILKRSFIYFKGKPNAPRLDIAIRYRHIGTTINIVVTGTPSEPSLNFSSTPHMSREQILSYILFDTDGGAGQNKTKDVTNLVAGTLVKSLMSSMGLKLDHLVLSGTGFEVGKKISDKMTIIYDKADVSSVKLKIQNTQNIETDISFGSASQSADIFYKREF